MARASSDRSRSSSVEPLMLRQRGNHLALALGQRRGRGEDAEVLPALSAAPQSPQNLN